MFSRGLANCCRTISGARIVANSYSVHSEKTSTALQSGVRNLSTHGNQESIAESNQPKDDLEVNIPYTVCSEDFKWVEKILPPSNIPDPPKHDSYPTPSGWCCPAENPPDLQYFIRRTKYHEIPVFSVLKKGNLRLTEIHNVEGDIWAFQEDLIEMLKPHFKYDPATTVHEQLQRIIVKGHHRTIIVKYLISQGF